MVFRPHPLDVSDRDIDTFGATKPPSKAELQLLSRYEPFSSSGTIWFIVTTTSVSVQL